MNKELIEFLGLMPTEKQIREAAKKKGKELGWNIEEALFPVNPFTVENPIELDRAVELLREYARARSSVPYSVGYSVLASMQALTWRSVWASMRRSVWDSLWDSVRGSLWASMRGSARDSLWDHGVAYISALFPNIKKWEGVEHEEGVNPFQSGADLWRGGYVATFDGKLWRLHRGKKAEVVWEGEL